MYNSLNSYSILEASQAFKVSYPKLLKAVRSGELPAFDVSYGTQRPRYRVYANDISDYVLKLRTTK